MKRKSQENSQMRRRRKNVMNAGNDTTTHLSVKIVGRNILPKRKMSVGNWKRTKTPALPIGHRQKAPEGARGPWKQRRGYLAQ